LVSKTGKESIGGLYRLHVTRDGTAYIKDNAGSPTTEDWKNHAVVFEFWNRSYVGEDAANDDRWVTEVYLMLKAWWAECLDYGPYRLPDAFYADSMPPWGVRS
jgi:hypothetical protein